MDVNRFTRLENRVDEVKNDVAEVKANTIVHGAMLVDMKDKLREHTELIKDHVAGDNKVINEIAPFMESFKDIKEIIADYKFEKETRKRRIAKIKEYAIKTSLASAVLGLIAAFLKFL